jgi:hypothetical protein
MNPPTLLRARQRTTRQSKEFLGAHLQTQFGIAAYLRNVASRCNRIARASSDVRTHDALAELTADLADKAEILERTFRVSKDGS